MPEFHADAIFLLLAQLAAILAVGRLLGIAARRVGQPSVIAEILAGIALGPSVLGELWPSAQGALFPASSMPVLSALSQVGLIFFMFLIGLEFDPRLIAGRVRASLIVSTSGIGVPFALAVGLASLIYSSLAPEGVPFTSFAAFLGVAMSITAFPVLARILAERRMLRSHIGAITLACAAMADATAWCILAFVVALVRAAGVHPALWTTGLTAIYVAAMFFAVRPLVARLGPRSREGVTQNLVAVVFFLVLASAMATEAIGIHALFGAFLMGAVMPRESEFAHALTQKVEDFVVVAILPLFFAVSGLKTEIGLVDSPERWLQCGAIIAVAVLGKFGGTAVAARLTGLGWRESGVVGVLMNTRGLMELIVLNIGLDMGVLSPALFTMMVLMALSTTAFTAPLLSWLHRPDERDRERDTFTGPAVLPGAGGPVLVCVADPAIAPGMVTLAAALTRVRRSPVLALHLVPAERATVYLGGAVDEVEAGPLLAIEEAAEEAGLSVATESYVSPRVSEEICRVAADRKAELTLLGFHRPLFTRTALGGVVRDVLQECPSQLGILVDRGLRGVQRVLVTLDDSRDGRAALALVQRLALTTGVRFDGLRVVAPGGPTTPRPEDPPGTLVVPTDDPTGALLHHAGAYDLVVVSMGEAWDLDPAPVPWHRETLVAEVPVSLLAVRAARE